MTLIRPYSQTQSSRRRFRAAWLAFGLSLACMLYGLFFALFAPNFILVFLIPMVVLGAMLIWVLPPMAGISDGLIETLFFGFLIALVMWPNYLAIALPNLPWITLIRIFELPLLIAVLVNISVSQRFVSRMRIALNGEFVVCEILVVFVAIQFISIAFSEDIPYSINRFIVAQTGWTEIFFVSCYVFSKPGRAEWWVQVVWLMALGVGCIAILENRQQSILWAGHIPSFLQIVDPTVQRILAGEWRSAIGLYRVQSTFSTSLGLAEFVALVMPFILHRSIGGGGRTGRIFALISIPVLLYVVFLTNSRLGIVGCLASFLLYGLFWGTRKWLRREDSMFGPAVVLSYPALFCATILASFYWGRLHALVWGNGPQDASTQDRVDQFNAGLALIFSHPWGYGIGMGASALGFVDSEGILTIDSYYLSVALEYGILGFFIFFGLLLFCAFRAGKIALHSLAADAECALLAPIAISLVNFIIIKSVFSQEDNHPLVFMLLGMFVALASRVRSQVHGTA